MNETHISVFAIFTEVDRLFYIDNIKPALAGIQWNTLEDEGMPNKFVNDNFEHLLTVSDKVLFVLSESFKQDDKLFNYPDRSLKKFKAENVVNVVRDSEIRFEDNINCLESSPRVMFGSDDWEKQLATALLFIRPPFCHYIGTPLESRGLTLRNMRMDIFGLAVDINNQVLRIDVSEFENYFATHKNIKTARVFGEYVPLYTDKTAVSILYKKKLTDMPNYLEFFGIISRLCGDVFNLSAAREQEIMTTLGATLEGPIRDTECIRRMWLNIFYKHMKQKESNVKMKHPSFQNTQKRTASFPESWSDCGLPGANAMAEAGLFFAAPPHVATCFMCGYTMFNWRDDDIPWEAHAAINKECPYINQNHSSEEIARAVESYTAGKFVPNERYRSPHARIGTFSTFNLDDFTKYRKKCKNPFRDREELIKEVSDAGFYFAGSNDLFSCYACGLMLSCISKKIMATHAKFSPECTHVLETGGRQFVDGVTANEEEPSIVTFFLRKFDNKQSECEDVVMSTAVRSRQPAYTTVHTSTQDIYTCSGTTRSRQSTQSEYTTVYSRTDDCGTTTGCRQSTRSENTTVYSRTDDCGTTTGSRHSTQSENTTVYSRTEDCGTTTGSRHSTQSENTTVYSRTEDCGTTTGSRHSTQSENTTVYSRTEDCGTSTGSRQSTQSEYNTVYSRKQDNGTTGSRQSTTRSQDRHSRITTEIIVRMKFRRIFKGS